MRSVLSHTKGIPSQKGIVNFRKILPGVHSQTLRLQGMPLAVHHLLSHFRRPPKLKDSMIHSAMTSVTFKAAQV